MSRKKRIYGAGFKAKVALAAVKGDKTLSELAKQFEVHPTQVVEWKQQLVERAADVFGAARSCAWLAPRARHRGKLLQRSSSLIQPGFLSSQTAPALFLRERFIAAPLRWHYRRYHGAVHPLNETRSFAQKSAATSSVQKSVATSLWRKGSL